MRLKLRVEVDARTRPRARQHFHLQIEVLEISRSRRGLCRKGVARGPAATMFPSSTRKDWLCSPAFQPSSEWPLNREVPCSSPRSAAGKTNNEAKRSRREIETIKLSFPDFGARTDSIVACSRDAKSRCHSHVGAGLVPAHPGGRIGPLLGTHEGHPYEAQKSPSNERSQPHFPELHFAVVTLEQNRTRLFFLRVECATRDRPAPRRCR